MGTNLTKGNDMKYNLKTFKAAIEKEWKDTGPGWEDVVLKDATYERDLDLFVHSYYDGLIKIKDTYHFDEYGLTLFGSEVE